MILRSLEEIKHEQREIKGMLTGLVQRLNGSGDATASVPNGVNLPLKSGEELREVETILQEQSSMQMMV